MDRIVKGAGLHEKMPKRKSTEREAAQQLPITDQEDPQEMQRSKVLEDDGGAEIRQLDEAEQEEMAILWAMEDGNVSAGWDEEKELDYTAIVRKPSGNPEPRQQEKDLFQYTQSTSFAVRVLGQLTGLQASALSEGQSDTLEEIEKAQRQGRLPWVTTEDQQRVLSISKYGVKVMDIKHQRVYGRYPLHAIANIIYYEDTYSKHMVSLRVIRSEEMICDLSIFECKDESQAKDICLTLAQAFETVFNRIQLQKR